MKVLVIDDSKAMRMIVKRNLAQVDIPDLEIIEAENGQEGLDLVHSEAPDIVFSDWNMPVMNGIELLQALRAEGNDIRFGFVTSENQAHIKDLALDFGAAFVIVKPFSAEDFAAVMMRVF